MKVTQGTFSFLPELTDEQIAFVRESLNFSAKAFRNASYEGQDREWVAEHRSEREALITSIRDALGTARAA